jgi:cytochrome c-type biogenesis protein CcmF
VGTGILLLFGIRHWLALLYFFSIIFLLATVYFEFSKGTQARKAMISETTPRALLNLVGKNRRRYGGFIIHTGVGVLFIGIAASSFFGLEKDAMVQKGQAFTARSYQLTFRDLDYLRDPHKEVVKATIEVSKNGQSLGFLYPERHFYKTSDQPTTEVALRSFWNEDLYIIIAGWDEQEAATFKVYVNPLVGLLWKGGFIMALGGLIILWPERKRFPVTSTAREDLLAHES